MRIKFLFLAFLLTTLFVHQTAFAGTRESLEKNRTILGRLKAQASPLEESDSLDDDLEARLSILQEKIRILEEDNAKLSALLPAQEQAEEFMKDLVYQPPANEPAAGLTTGVSTEVLHEKALALAQDEKFIQAAEVYEEIVLTDPEDDQAYLLMGHNYTLSGAYEKAQSAFKNAVHIDPSNQEGILPFYENLVLQNPEESLIRVRLGYVYLMMGNKLKARQTFEEALQIDPSSREALGGLYNLEAQPNS